MSLVASAEVLDLGTNTRINGRVSDISISGCYMDVMTPFAEGARIQLRIKYNGQSVDLQGSVRFSHGSLGMGIAFESLSPAQLEILGAWIGSITGERPQPAETPKFDLFSSEKKESLESSEKPALERLVELLVRKGVLTQAEVSELLTKL